MSAGWDMEETLNGFMEKLASKDPVPGGGGASALIGAVGVALCSMVANLTSGKKKYAEYQADIERILERTCGTMADLMDLIAKDAEVFGPLAAAYGIPAGEPGREVTLEAALVTACSVPLEILRQVSGAVGIIEELSVKGSRLAVSDVAVAASACRCAMESAAMNVYINTKLMKDRDYAERTNARTAGILRDACARCDRVYAEIGESLRCEG